MMRSERNRENNNFNRWKQYLFFEVRKGFQLVPFFLITIIVTASIVLTAAFLFSAAMGRAQILPKATVAIVCIEKDEETNSYKDAGISFMTRFGIGSVSQMKSVSTIADVSVMKVAEAEQGLSGGTVDAAIYITPDVYEDIDTGRNTPITVRFGRDAASLQGSLFGSLLSAGVRLIRTVEAAVYTPYALEGTYELTDTAQAIGDRIFDAWMKIILARGSMWGEESESPFGNISILEFYILSGILFIVMLFGIGFASFYTSSERHLMAMLRRSGMPSAAASGAKLLAAALVLAVFTAFLLIAGRCALASTGIGSVESGAAAAASLLQSVTGAAGGIARGIPAILISVFLIASFIHLCGMRILRGSFPLTYLLIVIVLFVVSGGLLPTAYLPPLLRTAAPWSPVAVCQSLIAPVLIPGLDAGSSLPIPAALAALAESAVFLIFS